MGTKLMDSSAAVQWLPSVGGFRRLVVEGIL